MIERHFGASAPFSLGVEEEVMILDAETLQPAPRVDVFVEHDGFKTELHASVVELTTPICNSVEEAVASLRALRGVAAEVAAANGLAIAAAGAHPTAALESLPVVQEERYLTMIRDVGRAARRQGVNGLHVHVGVASAGECWERLEAVLPWLPAVLALSANSPFVDGEPTGMLSNRAPILAELPRAGVPPAFGSYEAWEAWVERLVRLGVMDDYTRIWWDVRPHPRLGTLEVRVADQPTSLARTELLIRVIRELVASAPSGVADRGDYLQNRWAAASQGLDAELIHPDGTRLVQARGLLPFDPPEEEARLQLRADDVAADLVARTLG